MSRKSKSKVQLTEEELRINQDMIDIAKSDPETVEEVSNMTGLSIKEIKPTIRYPKRSCFKLRFLPLG